MELSPLVHSIVKGAKQLRYPECEHQLQIQRKIRAEEDYITTFTKIFLGSLDPNVQHCESKSWQPRRLESSLPQEQVEKENA